MMFDSFLSRVICWLCVVLILSLCFGEMCLAQTKEGFDDPDSVSTEPEPTGIYRTNSPVQSVIRDPDADPEPRLVDAEDDSLTAAGETGPKPVYKRWWVWAIAAVAVGVLVALAGGGSSSTADEDLPEFPDPPER